MCPPVRFYGVLYQIGVCRGINGTGNARSLLVGTNFVRPPGCHSEPLGEESRFAHFNFMLFEILRYAQDDKYNPQFTEYAQPHPR